MANLRDKKLRNGALIAMDYVTGQIVAYQGSANPTATKGNKRFQPRFDVLADGWRQPGSAFKPVVYATGIDARQLTAASMFMDVVTDFGGGYTPTDADNLERGPVRVRNALQFSLNIPAVKALTVIGNDRVQAKAEDLGVTFKDGQVDATAAFALGTEEVHVKDLVRAYGAMANRGELVYQTTLVKVTDGAGTELIGAATTPKPQQALDPGAAAIMTDILAGNTDPKVNPFWGKFKITEGKRRRPATLKTGTNNDARRPQRVRLHRRAEHQGAGGRRVRPGGRRMERQLGQHEGVDGQGPAVLDRRDDVRLAGLPPGGDRGMVDQRLPVPRTRSSRPRWIPGRDWRPRAARRSPSCSSTAPRRRRTSLRTSAAARPCCPARASKMSTSHGWPPTRAGWPGRSGVLGCAADPRTRGRPTSTTRPSTPTADRGVRSWARVQAARRRRRASPSTRVPRRTRSRPWTRWPLSTRSHRP